MSATSTWLLNNRPANNSLAFVDTNHIITLNANTTINYSLSFLKGSTLNLNGFTLTANRDLNFDATAQIIANGGTLIFARNGNQVIGNADYYNLELRGNGIKTFNVPLKVTNQLLLSSNITLETKDNLTLTSNSSYTARLLAVPSGATLNGKIKMERFIPANQRTWWQMSSPYSDVSASQYQAFFPITGSFIGANILNGNNNVSMFSYDETNTDPDYNIGWTAFPSANSSQILTVGKGYRTFLRADKSAVLGDLTISVLGTPNRGDISLPVSYTSTAGIDADGWCFVGNPYPCDIDWNSTSWTKTRVANAIYVWDAANSQYMTFVNGIGTNGGTRYVASSQGFWVRTTAANPILTAREAVKTTNNTLFKREELPKNVLFIEIEEDNAYSNTAISYDSSATAEFDTDLDAEFLNGENTVGICSHSRDLSKFYSVNSLPNSSQKTPIWVIHSSTKRSRDLVFTNLDNFDSEDKVFLLDKYLKDTIELSEGYRYSFSNDSKSASNGTQRFEILREKSQGLTSLEDVSGTYFELFPTKIRRDATIELHTNSKGVARVIITDILGSTWKDQMLNLTSDHTISSPEKSGLYLVRIFLENQEIVKKIIVE